MEQKPTIKCPDCGNTVYKEILKDNTLWYSCKHCGTTQYKIMPDCALNDKELFALEIFKRNHKCNSIGRKLVYLTKTIDKEHKYTVYETNTGISNTVYIKCNKCNTIYDVTDYRCW